MSVSIFLLLYILVIFLSYVNAWMSPYNGIQPQIRLEMNILRSSRVNINMQQRQGGGSGGTQLDNRTKQKTSTKPTFKEEIEKDWRLILHDDTVHTIQEVCEIIGSCCPLCPPARAYEVTLETHMTGAGTIAVSNKKVINEYTKVLQVAGLTVSCAPDDEFEGDGDGDFDDDE